MLVIDVNNTQSQEDIAVITLQGRLDASNYQDLIARAKQESQSGKRCLLLDLSNLDFISSAGMAALHSIVRMLRGEQLHNMENGWQVFHNIESDISTGMQGCLKLCSLQPNVATSLELTGLNRLMEIYADLPAALASYPC